MASRISLPRKIAHRLSARGTKASWSRPVVRIATTGVAVGIALIVVATSVVHGFQEEVKELVVGFGSDIQVLNADYEDQKIVRDREVERQLAHMEGVAAVHPFYAMPGIIESSSGVKGVMAKGVNEETSPQLLQRFIRSGTDQLGDDGAVLSLEQAQRLELDTGDRFTVYLVGGPTGVRARTVQLKGMYQTGLLEYDQEFMFLPAALIQQSAGWGLEVQLVLDSLGVEARAFGSKRNANILWSPVALSDSAGALATLYGPRQPWERLQASEWLVIARPGDSEAHLHADTVQLTRGLEGDWTWEHRGGGWRQTASGLEVFTQPDAAPWEVEHVVYQSIPLSWRTQTVMEQAPEMFTWLGMLDLNVEIIIGLMVLISIINMTSALLILILERRPMVGMLKALGMSNQAVMRVFFWQAVRILSRGFLWGNAVGLVLVGVQATTGWIALNPEAYYLDVVPVRLNLAYLGGVELIAFGMCAGMMWLPSWASTRIQPAEALRVHR